MDEGAQPETSTFTRLESQVLGGSPVLSLPELAARLGVAEERLVALWQPFGLPEQPDDKLFTERDAEIVGRLLAVGDENELGPATASSLVRSVAHLTDRLAVWQLEALVDHIAERYALDDVSARIVLLDRLGDLVPLLEDQLVHSWRHQLVGHVALMAAQVETEGRAPSSSRLPLGRAVGFADIESFTARTAGLSAERLADFVQGFETRARDVVSRAGGRTVKTIGDAVFFVADDARRGAAIALDLAAAFPVGGATPVRVGLVWGQVLARSGDVYGTPVNLAARLTAEAAPGEVLVDDVTADLLVGETDLRLTRLGEREVAGVGLTTPSRLERT